jgi:hypothetical protein
MPSSGEASNPGMVLPIEFYVVSVAERIVRPLDAIELDKK